MSQKQTKPYPAYKSSCVGWLGNVPEHWEIVQSRRLFHQRKDRSQEGDKQLTASQKYGVIYQEDFMAIEGHRVVQVIAGADILKHVEPNDFVISMRSFQGGIEWCGYKGCISSAYVMLTPTDKVHSRFFYYLLKSSTYIQALQSTTNLVRDGQALRYENFTLVDLPLVPIEEQISIAHFLDQETVKIDELMAEQRRLIDLLKEKRQAVISHAVTKGINPDAPMKDSGIEWLGEVPAHWEVIQLKHLVSTRKGAAFKIENFIDSGIPVVRASDIKNLTLRRPSIFLEHELYSKYPRAVLAYGEIILSTVGSAAEVKNSAVGQIAKVPMEMNGYLLNQNTVIFSPQQNVLVNDFLFFALQTHSYRDHLDLHAHGTANQASLNVSDMISFWLSKPPISEQALIAKYLDKEMTNLKELMEQAERAIEILQERRTALISAAVTGKIDVRSTVREVALV